MQQGASLSTSLTMSFIVDFFITFFITLFVQQFMIQSSMMLVRYCTQQKRNFFLHYSFIFLGLSVTRTKKDINEEAFLSFSLVFTSFISAFYRMAPFLIFKIGGHNNDFVNMIIALINAIILSMLTTTIYRLSRVFVILALYPNSRGVGLNFYWKGSRILGFDWHRWLVRYDWENYRFLSKAEQYFIWRPHVDIPIFGIEHWPFRGCPPDNIKKNNDNTEENNINPRAKIRSTMEQKRLKKCNKKIIKQERKKYEQQEDQNNRTNDQDTDSDEDFFLDDLDQDVCIYRRGSKDHTNDPQHHIKNSDDNNDVSNSDDNDSDDYNLHSNGSSDNNHDNSNNHSNEDT